MSTGIIRIISVLSSSFFSQVRNPDGISEVQSLVENGFEKRFICIWVPKFGDSGLNAQLSRCWENGSVFCLWGVWETLWGSQSGVWGALQTCSGTTLWGVAKQGQVLGRQRVSGSPGDDWKRWKIRMMVWRWPVTMITRWSSNTNKFVNFLLSRQVAFRPLHESLSAAVVSCGFRKWRPWILQHPGAAGPRWWERWNPNLMVNNLKGVMVDGRKIDLWCPNLLFGSFCDVSPFLTVDMQRWDMSWKLAVAGLRSLPHCILMRRLGSYSLTINISQPRLLVLVEKNIEFAIKLSDFLNAFPYCSPIHKTREASSTSVCKWLMDAPCL